MSWKVLLLGDGSAAGEEGGGGMRCGNKGTLPGKEGVFSLVPV